MTDRFFVLSVWEMEWLMRNRFWLGFFGVFLLLILSSCGERKRNRPLTILIPVEVSTLDPHFATSTIEWSILMNIFDALVYRNDQMELAPGLAERWEVDDSKKVWTFFLRKGVRFTNGEPFDARSVEFTFNRMLDSKLRPRTTFPQRIALDRVEVVDDHTVRIHTSRPVATVPVWLVNAFMLPPRHYSKTTPKKLARQPVGTGPYKLGKWVKDDFLRMEANPNWWKGSPEIQVAIWRPIPESSSRIAELETGAADIITNVIPDQIQLFRQKKRGIQIKSVAGGRRVFIGIRTDQGAFSDRRVRQAMNHAINFPLIARHILRGHGHRLVSVVNPPYNDPSIRPYPYDLEKAKALLTEAGLQDTDGDGVLEAKGQPLDIDLDMPLNRYLKGKEIAEAVAADLRAVGIHAEVSPLEFSVFLANRRKKTLSPLYMNGFSSAFDAELDLSILRPDLLANLTAWKNSAFIENYNRLRLTFDLQERKRLSFRLQRIVREDAPLIFLWNQHDFYGLSGRIRWNPRPDERIFLPSIQIAKKKKQRRLD
jgi:peptide/nickel transport system substrate-binding protein